MNPFLYEYTFGPRFSMCAYLKDVIPAVLLSKGYRLLLGGKVELHVGERVPTAGPAHQVVLPSFTSVKFDLPPGYSNAQSLCLSLKLTEEELHNVQCACLTRK